MQTKTGQWKCMLLTSETEVYFLCPACGYHRATKTLLLRAGEIVVLVKYCKSKQFKQGI